MKKIIFIIIALVNVCAFAGPGDVGSVGDALDSEREEYGTLTGVFVQEEDCVETGFALQTKDGLVCLGFHSQDLTERDLVLGLQYSLAGYLSEDGFFVTEFN